MTGRNCHSTFMGLVLNDNCSRRMLGGPTPLNGSLAFLKSVQVISSHLFLKHDLSNKSLSVWRGMEIKPEVKGVQVGMGMGYYTRGWDFSWWKTLETLNQKYCIFSLCLWSIPGHPWRGRPREEKLGSSKPRSLPQSSWTLAAGEGVEKWGALRCFWWWTFKP